MSELTPKPNVTITNVDELVKFLKLRGAKFNLVTGDNGVSAGGRARIRSTEHFTGLGDPCCPLIVAYRLLHPVDDPLTNGFAVEAARMIGMMDGNAVSIIVDAADAIMSHRPLEVIAPVRDKLLMLVDRTIR